MRARCVYVLQHENIDTDDVKFIGVFSSRKNGEKAIEILKTKPGFSEKKEGFYLDRYEINSVNWLGGFVTAR